MALNKQAFPINFAQGIDSKTDPFQVAFGEFLNLENSIFDEIGLLKKRNGYGSLTGLPDATSTFATTFNGNLMAIGTVLEAYSAGSETWVNKGAIQPASLSTLPLIRSNLNQSQADASVASNGLVCTVYTDDLATGSPSYKYAVADSTTGQNIIAPTVIAASVGVAAGAPKVFLLGQYFVIVFTNNNSGAYSLMYIAINSLAPSSISAAADISTQYTPAATGAFDGFVANNSLYLAWNGSDIGGAIRVTYLDNTLTQHNTVVFAGRLCTHMSVTADLTTVTPVIYATFYDSAGSTGYILAVSYSLATVLAPTQWVSAVTVANVTSLVTAGVATIYYEVTNAYSYDAAVPSNFIRSRTCTQGGSLGTAATVVRSVGLASKAFYLNDVAYFMGTYQSPYQPSYFLLKASNGAVIGKLAYSNGGGYLTKGLPSVTVTDDIAQVPYLIKDLVQAVNKAQGATTSAGVYSQKGINLATFTLNTDSIITAEIANDLHLSGGFLWMYDGYTPVEHGFHLWPDSIEVTTSGAGGLITAQQYFYQVTYEWSDNQGNVFRSAPSVPVSITTTGATSSNTINVPYLRLTYKTANPVKIVVYRWSTAQQTYYQVTSLALPTLNATTSDSVAIVDTLADSAIIGNNILYTAGGVVENIAAPACSVLALFKSRLVLIDAEDPNVIWYSKQVVKSVPVEMSDLFTIYVAPNIGVQGSTGPTRAAAALDDKLILFKANAIYYITGNGPDNTGANNDFSEPTFITATVGCENQKSIAMVPSGIMFQSGKGIWLLSRDLSTQYIGAKMERFTNGATVQSAVTVPNTNQVRFTLDTGITLVYDYFVGKWGTFTDVPAISSTIYEDLHTFINSRGEVYQETPGVYKDGSRPVCMAFTTGWLALAGLQGFQRAYEFYLLGTYLSPHKLSVSIAFDYNDSARQINTILPDNYNGAYGDTTLYGGESPYGGPSNIEQWRVFLDHQKCQSFQISLQEFFDPAYSTEPGAGFTLSGIDLTVGVKGTKPIVKGARQVG